MSSSGRSASLFRDHHHQSFSSTLLEEIYRSFDEEREEIHPQRMVTTSKSMKNHRSTPTTCLDRDNRFVIDQWMENEKINNLRRLAQSDGGSSRRSDHRRPINHSSSTSSSDSSSGIGGFSSSDTESMYGYSSKPKQKQPPPQLKPIRTTVNPPEFDRKMFSGEIPAAKKNKKEGNLQRRALKLYGDLKKVKQPISPGGKLSSFLNSLFNAGNSKKHKISSSSASISSNGQRLVRESVASTPSTTATSRSCLSKTPSSAGRFERRSVRFVVDEDHRGQWRNNNGGRGGDVAKRDSSMLANDEQFKHQMREKHRRVEEVAKELLKNYHNRKDLKVNIVADHHQHGRKFHNDGHVRRFDVEDEDEDEEEDDDDGSCCSSDLFELDVGAVNHRYREELPVYETTHVGTNRAIANGFIL